MERDDIIEKSMSPFNAPLLLVKKKADASGKEKIRIVIDFRALNNVTINEYHPLPNITEILDQLGQSQLFSIVDLKSGSDDKDEFETVAKETLDKIIEILEQDEINNTGSELIESVELDKLVEELDTFDEEIFNDKVENKPISSDVLNKSLRLINLDEFENSPTTNATRQGLRSNRNTIHTEYIQPKRTVKTKKMTGGSEMKPLNAIEAIKLIPDYSGQTEIYPFLNACEVIINTVDADQQPFMLKMIAATKLSDRAFNATRYKEIKVWEDMKKILLDAFETPYAAANLQIELNIIKMRYDETICAYNNRVEEIYQKLCNAVAIDKTPAEAKILRNNIREQALVSYINGLNDKLKFEVKTKNPTTLEQAMQIAIIAEKNIRTYNDVQEIFRTKRQEINSEFNVVDENFPIRKNGIVGNNFLSANNAVINLADKTLVINVNKNKQGELLLKPRSETIVSIPIAAKDVENKDIIIHKQEIMEGVFCGNIINTVQNGKVIISILNITEMPQNVRLNNLNKIRYDHEFEYNTQPIINNDNKRKRINEIRKSIRSDHMDNEQRQSILEICEHYQDIFYLTGDTLTCTDTLTHKINIPENQEPIYKRPYRLPHAQMAEIDSQIKQMEKDDIIEPSFSPWNAPLLLVKKKLDASQIPKFRIVVDFRALNKVTINEYHPLPNITEILDQLGQCYLFSIIDLASGFYQIKLDEKSKELTAFSTNQGHWHFKKMAMGLKTSPCSFQRLMNNVMAGIVGIKCLVYLDDIIIYGKGLLDHNKKLRDVFERLRNHNLKIQPTKCEFLKQQCMYLGHIISENGIQQEIGEVNYLRDKDRYIIFLTTKSRNKQKATYENIYLSLLNLKLLCEKHSLNKLAMNKLGFIDQLEWTQVRAMIRYVFRNTDIDVIICSKLEFTDEEKLMIFKQCHDSIIGGHVGIHRTIKKIKTQFNWRGLKEDVIEYIKNCESCQKGKVANRKVKQPMLITSTSSEPFEKIFLDIVGPLVTTLSGNTYILTLQDDLTKYSMGIALPNHQANTIAEAFVTNFVCTHGIPQTILTDQGTDFLSKIFTEVCKLLQINKINTSPFHPQTNGSLERSHRTLTEYLRHYVDKKLNNWDEYLPYAFFVYNSTEHTSTGYQPYSLLFGRRLEIPIKLSHEPEPRYNYDNYYFDLKQKMQESHKIAKENLIKRKVKSKQIYDNNENSIEIHVKDQILLRDKTQKNKLNPLWIGPYEVTDVLDRENIVILRGRRHVTVHKNNVKRFHENPS
ncbi:hypothetical protein QTP88_001860 [Uroleucon formosanum]